MRSKRSPVKAKARFLGRSRTATLRTRLQKSRQNILSSTSGLALGDHGLDGRRRKTNELHEVVDRMHSQRHECLSVLVGFSGRPRDRLTQTGGKGNEVVGRLRGVQSAAWFLRKS